jgi:hypothetical protein
MRASRAKRNLTCTLKTVAAAIAFRREKTIALLKPTLVKVIRV